MRSTSSLRSFLNVAIETVGLIDDGPFSSSQVRSLSASSFCAFLLQAINGVIILLLIIIIMIHSYMALFSSEND